VLNQHKLQRIDHFATDTHVARISTIKRLQAYSRKQVGGQHSKDDVGHTWKKVCICVTF
jgi:hypothetical protein